MTNPNPAAFNASLRSRIRTRAIQTGQPAPALRRQFFMQRFLARVFAKPDAPWIVTGGGGLLVRLPGVRSSQDIDLIRTGTEIAEAVAELRQLGGRSDLDPCVFRVELAKQLTGDAAAGAELTVSIYLGATPLADFPVDLAVDKVLIGEIETLTPTAVLEFDGFAALPPVRLVPVCCQVADKICAMVARYGATGQPSTRWRDLADLAFIVGNLSFTAEDTLAALAMQRRRRSIELPDQLRAPGEQWERGYPTLAKTTQLPNELHDLAAALAFVGVCLNPLLDGTRTHGRWDPQQYSWQ